MTTQLALGDVARDEAIDRVAKHNEAFLFAAAAAIDALAVAWEPFTADDVWAMMPSDMGESDPRTMGAAFQYAHKRDWIRPLGFVKSRRAACHGRPVREWIGVPICEHDRHDWKELYYD